MSVGGRATWWPDTTLRVAAALSLLAAAIHLWVMPEHLEEWWGYGTFFLVAALAQGLYALILLRRPDRVLLLAGVAGNLAILILWLVTRTTVIPPTGVPPPGPHVGEIEEVGVAVGLGELVMKDLATERRIQVVVVLAVSSLHFWHLLHLLGGFHAH